MAALSYQYSDDIMLFGRFSEGLPKAIRLIGCWRCQGVWSKYSAYESDQLDE